MCVSITCIQLLRDMIARIKPETSVSLVLCPSIVPHTRTTATFTQWLSDSQQNWKRTILITYNFTYTQYNDKTSSKSLKLKYYNNGKPVTSSFWTCSINSMIRLCMVRHVMLSSYKEQTGIIRSRVSKMFHLIITQMRHTKKDQENYIHNRTHSINLNQSPAHKMYTVQKCRCHDQTPAIKLELL